MQAERLLAGNVTALPGDLFEQPETALERLPEAFLFGGQDAMDIVSMLLELHVAALHLFDDDVRKLREVRGLQADSRALLNRAPDDPPHDVASAFVRGSDAVGSQKGHAAAVVGQDAMRLRRLG